MTSTVFNTRKPSSLDDGIFMIPSQRFLLLSHKGICMYYWVYFDYIEHSYYSASVRKHDKGGKVKIPVKARHNPNESVSMVIPMYGSALRHQDKVPISFSDYEGNEVDKKFFSEHGLTYAIVHIKKLDSIKNEDDVDEWMTKKILEGKKDKKRRVVWTPYVSTHDVFDWDMDILTTLVRYVRATKGLISIASQGSSDSSDVVAPVRGFTCEDIKITERTCEDFWVNSIGEQCTEGSDCLPVCFTDKLTQECKKLQENKRITALYKNANAAPPAVNLPGASSELAVNSPMQNVQISKPVIHEHTNAIPSDVMVPTGLSDVQDNTVMKHAEISNDKAVGESAYDRLVRLRQMRNKMR